MSTKNAILLKNQGEIPVKHIGDFIFIIVIGSLLESLL